MLIKEACSLKRHFTFNGKIVSVVTQLTFTCSKSPVETLQERCQICTKLTIKIIETRQRRSGAFIVKFEYTSHLMLVFL